jgi:hypothetical protein
MIWVEDGWRSNSWISRISLYCAFFIIKFCILELVAYTYLGRGGGEGCEGVELLRFGEFYFHKCENLIFFAACSCPIIITNHDLYTKQIEKL